MSDHDPNSDDDNPMHKIGYGRGDDVVVDRIVNVGEAKMEPTVPMEAVTPLTIQDIIVKLIEPYTQAWKNLPRSVSNRMMQTPADFQFVSKFDLTPDILYHGVTFRYNKEFQYWVVQDIS